MQAYFIYRITPRTIYIVTGFVMHLVPSNDWCHVCCVCVCGVCDPMCVHARKNLSSLSERIYATGSYIGFIVNCMTLVGQYTIGGNDWIAAVPIA